MDKHVDLYHALVGIEKLTDKVSSEKHLQVAWAIQQTIGQKQAKATALLNQIQEETKRLLPEAYRLGPVSPPLDGEI